MSFLEEPAHAGLRIPDIVITPAMPSRQSLPEDMRSVLDSIVGSASPSTSTHALERNTDTAVHSTTELVGDDGPEEGGDIEVPHTPSTSPAAAENHYLLQLDFENTRFSMGDVLSALKATSRENSRSGTGSEGSLAVDTPGASRANSPCGSDFVVVTDDMARSAEQEYDLTSITTRRDVPFTGKCPPTWRHAMRRQSSSSGSKWRWCGIDILARTLGLRRS
ncbi:hypothetical protein C8Q74DRAFT_1364096 [Fomes fomentarius]|nr:hypothetical protein C8Q74DRAFT_1364096 [Fomes fomentarius]